MNKNKSHNSRVLSKCLGLSLLLFATLWQASLRAQGSKPTDKERVLDHTKHRGYCGPVSLYLICRMFDIDTSVDQLASLAKTDDVTGTSMLDLREAAKALGLYAEGLRLTPREILELKHPAIAIGTFRGPPHLHYIVVIGAKDESLYCIDAPLLPALVPLSSFTEAWDGEVLVISRNKLNLAEISHRYRSRLRIYLYFFAGTLLVLGLVIVSRRFVK